MIAMFNTVKDFAKFNARPHLFVCGDPSQMAGNTGVDAPVYVTLENGNREEFVSRVEQFEGVALDA